jgi:phosphoenolpyruvate carboxylase
MGIALTWQSILPLKQWYSIKESIAEILQKNHSDDNDYLKDFYQQYSIAGCKLLLTFFMAFMCTLFPTIFYIRYLEYIDDDQCAVCLLGSSLATKFFYIQILNECQFEILNPTRFVSLQERRMAS